MFKVSRPYKIAIMILTEMVFLLVKVPYMPYGMANFNNIDSSNPRA